MLRIALSIVGLRGSEYPKPALSVAVPTVAERRGLETSWLPSTSITGSSMTLTTGTGGTGSWIDARQLVVTARLLLQVLVASAI